MSHGPGLHIPPEIRRAFELRLQEVWVRPLRLQHLATTDLPPAAEWTGGLVWDTTAARVTYSDGTAWQTAQPYDATLAALGALDATAGVVCQTGADTFAKRTLTAPAAGITIANPTGAAGNPAFALANDLAAVEGLSATGIVRRTGADTWSAGTLVSLTAEVAGTLPVVNGGTGATTSTGTGSVVLSASPTLTGTLAGAAAKLTGALTLPTGAWSILSADGKNRVYFGDLSSTVYNSVVNHIFRTADDGTIDRATMSTAGLNVVGTYSISGTQVITSRRTGWAAPTGTATRTTFDTATVTTAQLAERVKALIDDLTTHGLIGA